MYIQISEELVYIVLNQLLLNCYLLKEFCLLGRGDTQHKLPDIT